MSGGKGHESQLGYLLAVQVPLIWVPKNSASETVPDIDLASAEMVPVRCAPSLEYRKKLTAPVTPIDPPAMGDAGIRPTVSRLPEFVDLFGNVVKHRPSSINLQGNSRCVLGTWSRRTPKEDIPESIKPDILADITQDPAEIVDLVADVLEAFVRTMVGDG